MRSINIDPVRFINLCVSNGIISPEAALAAIKAGMSADTKLPITQHCGHFRTELNDLGSMFVATDRETKQPVEVKDRDGNGTGRFRFNFRSSSASARKKQEASSTPGAVLPTDGAPQLDAQTLQALSQLVAQANAAQAEEEVPEQVELTLD